MASWFVLQVTTSHVDIVVPDERLEVVELLTPDYRAAVTMPASPLIVLFPEIYSPFPPAITNVVVEDNSVLIGDVPVENVEIGGDPLEAEGIVSNFNTFSYLTITQDTEPIAQIINTNLHIEDEGTYVVTIQHWVDDPPSGSSVLNYILEANTPTVPIPRAVVQEPVIAVFYGASQNPVALIL